MAWASHAKVLTNYALNIQPNSCSPQPKKQKMLQPLRLQHFLLAQKSNHSHFPGIGLFDKPVKPVCCLVLCLRQCPFVRCRHFVIPALERWIDNDNMPQRWNQRLKKSRQNRWTSGSTGGRAAALGCAQNCRYGGRHGW